jgi:predicted DNA-binding protein (MmcQ/YjbR family)
MPPLRKRRPDVLSRLREVCLALPGASEATQWGHPNFLVEVERPRSGGRRRAGREGAARPTRNTVKKTFAVYEKYQGEWAICFKAEPALQLELVTSDPRFYVTPYIGKQGWVSMKVEGMKWPETRRFIKRSYELVLR